MPNSILTGVRARSVNSARSVLTGVRARSVGGPSTNAVLTGVRARSVTKGNSILTGVRARSTSPSGPLVVLTGPTAPVEPKTVFQLSTVGSSDGPFTGYQWAQLSGPAAELTPAGATCTVVAPVARPNPAGWPNDSPIPMVFQAVVEKGGVQAAAEITVQVYPHGTWSGAGPAMFWHFPAKTAYGTLATNAMSSSATNYPLMQPPKVGSVMDEWSWRALQPGGPGTGLDSTAVAARQTKWAQYKTVGFPIRKVGLGLHFEPQAALDIYPLGSANQNRVRFQGTDGTLAQVDGGDALDGVWSAVVRDWYADYLTRMADVIPFSEIDVIRITSGSRSELLYPEQPSTRRWSHAPHVQGGGQYLAADQSPPPVTGWDPSNWSLAQRRAEAEWYLRSLVNAAIWQMNLCRSLNFRGKFEITVPGRGLTVTGYESDISTGLPQSSLLSRGAAWHKVAEFLPADPMIRLWATSVGQAGTTDTNRIPSDADYTIAVTSSTANSWAAYRWIRRLAYEHGYEIGGENPGLGMGADSTFFSDLTQSGLMQRFMSELNPPNAAPAAAGDWAHADTFRTVPGLLDLYLSLIDLYGQQ